MSVFFDVQFLRIANEVNNLPFLISRILKRCNVVLQRFVSAGAL